MALQFGPDLDARSRRYFDEFDRAVKRLGEKSWRVFADEVGDLIFRGRIIGEVADADIEQIRQLPHVHDVGRQTGGGFYVSFDLYESKEPGYTGGHGGPVGDATKDLNALAESLGLSFEQAARKLIGRSARVLSDDPLSRARRIVRRYERRKDPLTLGGTIYRREVTFWSPGSMSAHPKTD